MRKQGPDYGSRNKPLTNNLANIRVEDPIYSAFTRILPLYLPENIRNVYEKSRLIQIVAVDSFFLHYSLVPIIVDYNENRLLEEVRRLLQEYVSTENYRLVRKHTLMNEKTSLIHTITLVGALIEKLRKKSGAGDGVADESKAGEKGGRGESEEGKDKSEDRDPSTHAGGASEKNSGVVDESRGLSQLDLRRALKDALIEASKATQVAGSLMSIIGGGGASLEKDSLKKLVDLSRAVREVRDVERIIELTKESIRRMPRFFKVNKTTDLKGESIRGYGLTRILERVIPRELALPDDIFYAKMTSQGLLFREKESIVEGALYVLLDKCLPGDEEIALADGGRESIKKLRVGEAVLSPMLSGEGTLTKWTVSRVTRVVYGGRKEFYRVIARSGEVTATPNHVVPVVRGGSLIEIPLALLREGDRLLLADPETNRLKQARVEKVEYEGVDSTYDVMLEENHLFLAGNVVVHNSGSMGGVKLVWSRSLALALYRVAKAKKRKFMLRLFDAIVHPEKKALTDPVDILDAILRTPAGGGTRIANAVYTALDEIMEHSNDSANNIVLITDGEDRVDIDRKKIEKTGVSLITVMVGGNNEELRRVSDEYLNVALDVDGALTVIKTTERIAPLILGKPRFMHT